VETQIESRFYPRGALHAMLFWKPEGGAKTIIPTDALLLPNAETHGLAATYSWLDHGETKVVTQTDKRIDFAWPAGGLVISGDTTTNETADAMASLMWNRVTSDQMLEVLEQVGETHPLLQSAGNAAGFLTSEQRQSFIRTLVLRKLLLDPVSPMDFLWVYRSFRMGATDEALELFGAWSERRTNMPCEFPDAVGTPAIDYEMRKACRRLAICFTYEIPEQLQQLRDEYLELADGRCSLPVAYTLAYSYQGQQKIGEWAQYLDERLDNDSLVGDERVSWLIARSHADEIRAADTNLYRPIGEFVLDGYPWLKEAKLHAQSPEAKVLIAKEIAARFAAIRQFDDARKELDEVTAEAPANLAADIAEWKVQIDSYEAKHVAQRDGQADNARAAVIKTLQARRDAANARGDTDAVGRYDERIQRLNNQ
jgi:hypothetical protein